MSDGIVKSIVLLVLAGSGYVALRTYQHRNADPELAAQERKSALERQDANVVQQLVDRLSAGPRVVDVLVLDRSEEDPPRIELMFQERTAGNSLIPARRAVINGDRARFTAALVPLNRADIPAAARAVAASARVPLLTSVVGNAAPPAATGPASEPATRPDSIPAMPIDEPDEPPFIYRAPEIPVGEFQHQIWKELWQSARGDAGLTTLRSDWVPLETGDVVTLTLPPSGPLTLSRGRLTPDALAQLREAARKLTPETTLTW